MAHRLADLCQQAQMKDWQSLGTELYDDVLEKTINNRALCRGMQQTSFVDLCVQTQSGWRIGRVNGN